MSYEPIVLSGDITGNSVTGAVTTTLATVNSNVGSFTSANITVNAKGLITAAANGSGGGSGTVNSGTANQLAYYATTGTAVSGTANATMVSGTLTLVPASTSTVSLSTTALSSQTAALAQWFNSSAALRGEVAADGGFSNGGGQSTSEIFGLGASVSGSQATALGNSAAAVAASIAIGQAATASQANSVAIGRGVVVDGTTSGGNCVAIGYQADILDTSNYVIALGSGATIPVATNNLFVAGSSSGPMTDVYFGKGVTNGSATAYTIHGTGGSGSNNAGAALQLAGGAGTGTGAGGSILFQVAAAGSSGSTANSLATLLTLDSTKLATFADAANIAVGTSTGTKIGTSTSQKLGFFNATPVVQQTGNISSALSALGLVTSGTLPASDITGTIPAGQVILVTTVSFASTVTPVDGAPFNVFNFGTQTGNVTIAAPSGSPIDGDQLEMRFVIDGTGGYTTTFNSIYAFGTDVTTSLIPTAASSKFEIKFIYNATDSKWRAMAIVRGF